jgi:hypothetical protein
MSARPRWARQPKRSPAKLGSARGGPDLSRSRLHRLYQRRGISRLPDLKYGAEPKRTFKSYSIGNFHVDIADVRTAEGKL